MSTSSDIPSVPGGNGAVDYDNGSILAWPNTMNVVAAITTNLVTDISTQIETVSETLSDLQLSWVGESASLAKSFQDRWNGAITTLFGTKKDQTSGLFDRLINGIDGAAQNYAQADDTNMSNLVKFANALAPGSTSTPSGTPTGVDNTNGVVTAITEIYH